MADFQSSLTAKQIEKVLTGAVVFNASTSLSEEQKAQARENIGATPIGFGIKITAHFATFDDLEAAVPYPVAGDAYSVGIVVPYDLYIYDNLHGSWVNYGPIRSADINARFLQDLTVAMDDWETDDSVFTDYKYKASIPAAEVTKNDFPIVAFSPSDAAGGNFCPIAYTFDGIVQIFAKSIPAAAITIPAITFIVQGGTDS